MSGGLSEVVEEDRERDPNAGKTSKPGAFKRLVEKEDRREKLEAWGEVLKEPKN